MKLSFFITLITFLFIPTLASADEDIRAYTIENKKFVCFDEPSALKVLQLRLEFPKLKSKTSILLKKLEIKEKEIQLLDKNTVILKDKLGIIAEDNEILRKKLEDANTWYKSPWMWFGVGMLVGGVVALGAVALSG